MKRDRHMIHGLLVARSCASIVTVSLGLFACNNPGATTSSDVVPRTVEAAGYGSGSGPVEAPASTRVDPAYGFSSFAVGDVAGGSGGQEAEEPPLGPPYGTSAGPADAIVGPDEECDDGLGDELDACTAAGQTRDQPVAPAASGASRVLGAGRHPVAGFDQGFVAVYEDFSGDEPTVTAARFDIWGKPLGTIAIADGAFPISTANPVVAALPGGRYAVAWSDFDVDGSDLGVALREVDATGDVGGLKVANANKGLSQLNADLLLVGSQLVVAWEDYANAATGPDLRYRIFDTDLNPISADQTLASSALPEAAVALAPFDNGWAAAYREGTEDGTENVVVKAGDKTFRIGPLLGGPLDDRPALVELDGTHLLVVFSAGTDPVATGLYNVPRIRYAIVDTAGAASLTPQSLDPLDDIFSSDTQVSHLSPAAERIGDAIYVAWRSEARPGDAAGDQLWLKYLSWDAARAPALEIREGEMLIPRTCEGSIGDQRTPALGRVQLPPNDALAIAWDDYAHAQGPNSGEPEVVVHYAPVHPRLPANGFVFEERFTGANGAAWPSQWTGETFGVGTLTSTIQANEGEVRAAASSSGTVVMQLNQHTALNVEMDVDVRFNLNSARGGFIARRADDDSDSYVAVRFGTLVNSAWDLYAVLDGTLIVLDSAPMPYLYTYVGQASDNHMRMRVVTEPDGDLYVAAKFWEIDVGEPEGWLLEATLSATSAAPLRDVHARLAARPGRFGLVGTPVQAGRTTTFDDFRASFFEGDHLGDLDEPVAFPWPLRRSLADYRECKDGSCTEGQGCCFASSDCADGLKCSSGESQLFGLGSHAMTCSQSHCSNLIKDADEVRADCGGAACAPCAPACKTGGSGTPSYCTVGCPCGIGEGDCSAGTQCLGDLLCSQRGFNYGNVAAADDVCIPQHCRNRILDAHLGEGPNADCGGECGTCACPPGLCTQYCPCSAGQVECDYHDDCAGSLLCGAGARWGLQGNACVGAHCSNKIFEPQLGETSVDCGGDCGPICL